MFDLGVQHGAAKSYHENGTYSTDENWVDGKLDGNQRSYYSNGQLKICSDYTVGIRNGDHLEYFENGRLSVETHLFEGKVIGTHRQFMNNEESTVIFEAEYLDGILEGKIRMLCRRTLAITLEGIVSDLKKTLKLFKYFTNGKLDTQLQVDLFSGQGHIRRYYSNGQIYLFQKIFTPKGLFTGIDCRTAISGANDIDWWVTQLFRHGLDGRKTVLTAADFVNVENIEKTGPENHKDLIGILKDQYGVSFAFRHSGEFKGGAGGIGLAPRALFGRSGGGRGRLGGRSPAGDRLRQADHADLKTQPYIIPRRN